MKKIIPSVIAFFAPVVAFAQFGNTVASGQDVGGVLNIVDFLLGTAIPIIVTLAVAWFFWGVVMYFISNDEEKKKKARSQMIMGIIGIFVIVALWGIIGLLSNTLNIGIGGTGEGVIPTI